MGPPICGGLGVGNSKTLLTPAYGALVTDLKADQTLTVGTVTVDVIGTNLIVTYAITAIDWYLLETHLAVALRLSDIPQTRSGNPTPGRFAYTMDHVPPDAADLGGTTSYTYTIPLSEIGANPGNTICIAAQANVGQFAWANWDNDANTPNTYGLVLEKTAWSQGLPFPDAKSWAMYFTFVVPVQ